ncbi:MAG: sugar phosphate isomerase/epimerase [Victivallaceae bacterium]|nr:sugar phosphate isomerase/epimerase [Victivallaceae bacterium]
MNMRLGLAAWGLRETPLEQQLAMAQKLGVGLLELSIAGYDKDFLQPDASDEAIAKVKRMFADYGIKLECGCTGNDFTNDDAPQQLARVKKVIDIAGKLGIGLLRIFAGFNSDSVVYGARFDRMIECLREAASYAKTRGVTLAVETHGGVAANGDALVHFASVTTRVDTWPAILATGVEINYDPANFAAAGATSPYCFYDEFKAHIKYVHLKDFRTVSGGVKPAACGEGRLDWPRLMRTLAGYDGPALIEYELTGDVEDGMRRSLDYLKQF